MNEINKKNEKRNEMLINQSSKTIVDNSKILAEFYMAPPIILKLRVGYLCIYPILKIKVKKN